MEMANVHIQDAISKLTTFFFRCRTNQNYKALMFVKKIDNLKEMLETIIAPVEKENKLFIKEICNDKNSHSIYFKNDSCFSFLVIDDINIIGEQCHVLFVDSQIREKELMELEPVINIYESMNGFAMLNPKPIYINLQ